MAYTEPGLWTSPIVNKILDSVKYYYYDVWNIYGDPRVADYPFMDGGPWSTIAMIAGYLLIVKYFGPNYMKDRKPFDMRNLILLYNISLVAVNGWLFYTGTWITNFGLDSWKCQAVDRQSRDPLDLYKIHLGWYFYLTKTIDFCDTFFFVLRKKNRQVSSLHVFHHSCMPLFCWIGLKFTPGGNNAFFPWLNSGVHTVMYSYYALSTFPELQPYLWWKKYITSMQMIQFIAVIIHSLYSMSMPGCAWPKMFIYLSIFNAFLFFCMFYSFFKKTYSPKTTGQLSSPSVLSKSDGVGDSCSSFARYTQACKPDHVNGYSNDFLYSGESRISSSQSSSSSAKVNCHLNSSLHGINPIVARKRNVQGTSQVDDRLNKL